MQKGMAIIENTGAETKAVFIDHEVLECARLNSRTEKRVAEAKKEHKKFQNNQRKAEKAYQLAQRKAEKEHEQFKAFTLKTLKDVLICGGIIGLAVWGGYVGMIHPVIAIPVLLICLSIASVKAGIWFGKKR